MVLIFDKKEILDRKELSIKYNKVVFELYQHELGFFSLQGWAVNVNELDEVENEKRVTSVNVRDYCKEVEDYQLKVLKVLDQLDSYQVFKKYNTFKKVTRPDAFFEYLNENQKNHDKKIALEVKRLIDEIKLLFDSNIYKALQLLSLSNEKIYFQTIAGFTKKSSIQLNSTPLTIKYKLKRGNPDIELYAEFYLEGKRVYPHKNESIDFQIIKNKVQVVVPKVITRTRGSVLFNNNIYFFETADRIDKEPKLPYVENSFMYQPFMAKEFLTFTLDNFKLYFEKLIDQAMTHRLIDLTDFEVIGADIKPVTLLKLTDVLGSGLCLSLLFQYDDNEVFYGLNIPSKVKYERSGNSIKFQQFSRDFEAENKAAEWLQQHGLELFSGSSFKVPGASNHYAVLEWMNHNSALLAEAGIQFNSNEEDPEYYFIPPNLDLQIVYEDDWFDIKAKVNIGEFQIAFSALRNNILKGIREFVLPDGRVAILPEVWFSQLKGIATFAESEEDDTLRLNKIFFPVIQELEQAREDGSGIPENSPLSMRLKEMLDFESEEIDVPLSPHFKASLREYQQKGLEWLWRLRKHNFGGVLADDMGLGKTVQTLALLQNDADTRAGGQRIPSVLVVPSSLVFNWYHEIKKFSPELRVFIYSGQQRAKSPMLFRMHDIVITTYGTVRVDLEMLRKIEFNYVILDEGQSIKNPDAAISKAVKQLHSKRRLVLSGTPIENSLLDLWSIFQFAIPGLLGTEKHFKENFSNQIEKGGNSDAASRLHRLINPFILRRTKEQVAKDLPPKIEQVMPTMMTDEQEAEYEKVKSSFRNEIMQSIETIGLQRSQFLLLRGLTQLRQIANHPKLVNPDYTGSSGKFEQVMSMIQSALDEGHKMLVFSQFVRHLKLVREALEARGISYEYLDGSTDSKSRKDKVNRFESSDETRIFLLSLKAGGLGLNLTSADYVVLLDPWWNPAVEAQAIDRSHRIGQTKTVFSYKFITENTVEEKILKLQERKRRLSRELIGNEESLVKALDVSDVLDLLS